MCGICGVMALEPGRPIEPAALSAMCATLVHRGPDSEGMLIAGQTGLLVLVSNHREVLSVDLPSTTTLER